MLPLRGTRESENQTVIACVCVRVLTWQRFFHFITPLFHAHHSRSNAGINNYEAWLPWPF